LPHALCAGAACRAWYEATGAENLTTSAGFVLEEGDDLPHSSDQIRHRLCFVCQGSMTILDT
jgi:hypothetical protein